MRLLPRPARDFATRGTTFRRGLSNLLLLPGSPGQMSLDSLGRLWAPTAAAQTATASSNASTPVMT
jgi:hypothetical protein